MNQRLRLVAMPVAMIFTGACASVDLTRAAHDILKQQSCMTAEPRGLCNRNWDEDYRLWQAQRADYLQLREDEKGGRTYYSGPVWLQPPNTAILQEH